MIDQTLIATPPGPVSVTRTTRPTGYAPSSIVAVATVAQTVGSVISKIGSFLGSVFKGKTTHADWDSANNAGLQYGQELETSVRNEYGNSNADKISVLFRQYMIAYLQAITRWGEGYPENKQNIINVLQHFNPALPQQGSIAFTFWGWNMWAMRNTDVNRPDDYKIVAETDMRATLYRAIFEVTGKTVSTVTPTGTVTTTPNVSPDTASLFSGGNIWLIAALGVGAFFAFKKG